MPILSALAGGPFPPEIIDTCSPSGAPPGALARGRARPGRLAGALPRPPPATKERHDEHRNLCPRSIPRDLPQRLHFIGSPSQDPAAVSKAGSVLLFLFREEVLRESGRKASLTDRLSKEHYKYPVEVFR